MNFIDFKKGNLYQCTNNSDYCSKFCNYRVAPIQFIRKDEVNSCDCEFYSFKDKKIEQSCIETCIKHIKEIG